MTFDNSSVSRTEPVITTSRSPLHRAAGTGAMYLGPGDVYRFLVTGADTAGAYFAMEAIVAPGGGPPPHIHRHEDETFYVVEGQCGREFFVDGDPRAEITRAVMSRRQPAHID